MEAFGPLLATLSAFRELVLFRALAFPRPVDCHCEVPAPESAVTGECRLLADPRGPPDPVCVPVRLPLRVAEHLGRLVHLPRAAARRPRA
eukprot:4703025-Pyramimonas_sp.AAC.1